MSDHQICACSAQECREKGCQLVEARAELAAERERVALQENRICAAIGDRNRYIDERDALRARVTELEATLNDAKGSVEAWGAYASDYFKEKHDLAGDIARIDAALKGGKDG